MTKIELNVKDEFLSNVLNLLKSVEGVLVESFDVKSGYLKEDPYYFERKKDLQATLDAIESGEMELIDDNSWEELMKELDQKLEKIDEDR